MFVALLLKEAGRVRVLRRSSRFVLAQWTNRLVKSWRSWDDGTLQRFSSGTSPGCFEDPRGAVGTQLVVSFGWTAACEASSCISLPKFRATCVKGLRASRVGCGKVSHVRAKEASAR